MEFLGSILGSLGGLPDLSMYAGLAAAVILVFDRLSKLTPNETDNKLVEYLRKLFSLLGLRVKDR